MILRIRIILFLLFLVTLGFSQKINYRNIRYTIFRLPSGEPDSLTLWSTICTLEALDTNNIKKHLAIYYTDLGWSYWLLCNINNTPYDIDLALKAYRSALYHKPKNSEALWHCSLAYYHQGECEKARYYMKSFKKHTQEKYWNTEYIAQVETNCQ